MPGSEFFSSGSVLSGSSVLSSRLLLVLIVLIGPTFARFAFSAVPEEALELLRAADELRQTNAKEEEVWAGEEARLELLVASLKEQTSALRRRAEKARADLRKQKADTPPPPEAILGPLEDGAEEMAETVNGALDRLSREVPPGLVPPPAGRKADPRAALDGALHRLERAERATRTIEVTVVTGHLDARPRSVELLRFGGARCWWRGLDGQTGGEARMNEGRLELFPLESRAELDAIARASAIAKGRRAPEIVVLPVLHARTARESEP